MKAYRLFLFSVSLAAPAWAAPEERPTIAVTAKCQMVVLSAKLALTLIPDLSDDTKILTAWPRVEEKIGRGEVTLSATLLVKGTTGNKLVAESTEEIRYATFYDPPQIPESFFDPPAQTVREPSTLEMLKKWPVIGLTPGAFETQALGQRMELSLTPTSDPKVAMCSFELSDVRHPGNDRFEAGKLANGEHLAAEQPRFTKMRDTSATLMQSGRPKLVGVHQLPGPQNDFELFVLTLSFTPARTE